MNIPKIRKIKHIDTNDYPWCDDAVLVQVSNGKGALTTVSSEYDADYHVTSQLLLNGKPILQGKYPACPTCSALLARGYGIENTDIEELQIIRDKINSGYTNIDTAVNNIAPILGLLQDGYYVIADAKLYPTSGDRHFFANVPDALTTINACCNDYYNHVFLEVTEGFPAYIYPSQSNKCLNRKYAEIYMAKIDKQNAPRAVAYYNDGFINVLLDGHHKAYAAALRGVRLRTLVVIRMTGRYKKNLSSNDWKTCFSAITVPAEDLPKFKGFPPVERKNVIIEKFTNIPIPENDLILAHYPTIEELSGYYAADLANMEITDEVIHRLLQSEDNDDHYRIKCALGYFEHTDLEKACRIARLVISQNNNICQEKSEAFRVLLKNKNFETGQLFIKYIVDHDPSDTYWKIANSYWNEE